MESSNKGVALLVDSQGLGQVVRNVVKPSPEAGEILVEVLYSGSNPADIHHALLGIKNTVMGYDFMGRVTEVGSQSKFAVGDLVAGYTPTGIGRPLKYGAHQPYLVAPEDHAWRVPDSMPHPHAAALTVVAATASDALFNVFKFPLPGGTSTGDSTVGSLLIWGASTSVGLAILQLARASGAHPIFVTASPKRHDILRRLGATQCFDYADVDVISKIEAAVEAWNTGPILFGADCVGSPETAQKLATIASEPAKLVSTREQQDQRFSMAFANKARETSISLPGIGIITMPAYTKDQAQIWKGLEWVVRNYGSEFSLPLVNVFQGSAEDALEQVKSVAEKSRFGKLVLKQPLA